MTRIAWGLWIVWAGCAGKVADTAHDTSRPPTGSDTDAVTDTDDTNDTNDTDDTDDTDTEPPIDPVRAFGPDVGGWMSGQITTVSGGVDLGDDGVPDLVMGYDDVVRVLSAPPAPGDATSLADITTATLRMPWLSNVATARDLNGDGRAELIAVSREADGGAWLVSAPVPDGAMVHDVATAHLNLQLTSAALDAGDLTGDGVDDLVLVDRGYGSSWHCSDAQALVLAGPISGEVDALASQHSGFGVECGATSAPEQVAAGDVDGDGVSDLIFATPNAGAEYHSDDLASGGGGVSFGPLAAGATTGPDVILGGAVHPDELPRGQSITVAGDVTGDGIDDVLLGGYAFVAVYELQDHTPVTGASTTFVSEDGFGRIGTRVAALGDVDGDGFDDVMVTANPSNDQDGRAYLLYGPLSGLEIPIAHAPATLMGPTSRFGEGLWVGDMDGDDRGDAVILDPEAAGALWLPGSVWSTL